MSSFTVCGAALALVLYVPFGWAILSGKVEQNFVTFFLWTVLDAILAGTIAIQHGNFVLPAAYVLGTGTMTVFIFLKSRWIEEWTSVETLVVGLVVICVTVWISSGPEMAIVASGAATLIAGIPQLLMTYRTPWKTPFRINAAYAFANILCIAGGKEWSIEERLFPTFVAGYCLLQALLAIRKLWVRPVPSVKMLREFASENWTIRGLRPAS